MIIKDMNETNTTLLLTHLAYSRNNIPQYLKYPLTLYYKLKDPIP